MVKVNLLIVVFDDDSSEVAIEVVWDTLCVHHKIKVVILNILRSSRHAEVDLW